MKIVKNGHRVELYEEGVLDRMIMTRLENRSTTYAEMVVGGRSILNVDKTFYLTDKTTGARIFSINQLPEIETFLKSESVSYDIETRDNNYPIKPTKLSLKPGMTYRDDVQRNYAKFLDENDFNSYLCTLQTGKGKTGSTLINLLSKKNKSRISILLLPKYTVIWTLALQKFTDIKEDEILILSGRESLIELANIPDSIKVVILSPVTIRQYMLSYYNGEDNPFNPSKIMKYIGSEYLIIDEGHENFAGNYLTTLALNPRKYIVLTASYESIQDHSKITKFKRFFVPNEHRLPVDELDKFINIVFGQFRFSDIRRLKYAIGQMKWYNHSLLEESIMKDKGRMYRYFNMILYFAETYYDNKHRMLFLFKRRDMCMEFTKFITKRYPKKSVVTYISGDSKENLKKDIIVSTDKSSGTGLDIENLQTTINTISTKSDYSAIQFSGRNRKMEGVEQYYITLWSMTINAQANYRKANELIYRERAKKMYNNYYNDEEI